MDSSSKCRVSVALLSAAFMVACALPLTIAAKAFESHLKPTVESRPITAVGSNPSEGKSKSKVWIETNYFAKAGETFQVYVSLHPASGSKAQITMDPTWGVTFSPSSFVLGPGERGVTRAAISTTASGLVKIHALSPGYDDGWLIVVVDFDGVLKLESTPTLSYNSPSTLALTFVDSAGKPLRSTADLELHLASADGQLSDENSGWVHDLTLSIPSGSRRSPDFKILSTSVQGGSVHLSGTLLPREQTQVLTQEGFPLNADPATWLPVLLAMMGGFLHGCYTVLRMQSDTSATRHISKVLGVLTGSLLAGLIGYFFAHLDLLGLKLDPNVLRSYPLIGFLFSYFGFEVLLPKRGARGEDANTQGAAGDSPGR